MFNFYVVLAGREKVADSGRATTCRNKFRAPPLQTKLQKVKVLPKTWLSPNNRLKISDQRLKTFTFGNREQNKGTTKTQKQQLKIDLVFRKK